jgi:ABC-2 type transport system permease protein
VLMLIAIFVCALISARIYRLGILMYSQKPGLGQLQILVRMKQGTLQLPKTKLNSV